MASDNGFRGVAKAVDLMIKGADTLDAGVEGVKIQELDPNDHSVGYGGLPNAEGVVQLDASCMHGPSKRAGAVGALEGIKTPSEIVRLIMKYTPHIMLVGKDAQRFAVSYGYQVEDLLTPGCTGGLAALAGEHERQRQLPGCLRSREDGGAVHHRHQPDDAAQSCRATLVDRDDERAFVESARTGW